MQALGGDAFCREYDKVAESVDRAIVKGWRRIVENMFPGWTVQRLFAVQEGPISSAAEPSAPIRPAPTSTSQIGEEYSLAVPRAEHGESIIDVFSLPNPKPGRLLDLNWETFGLGIERLAHQIKNLGSRLDVDICFGVNEAGLVLATFLSSSRFARCPIGYLRCNKTRGGVELDEASVFPMAKDRATIVICDFEVKHSDVIGCLAKEIRSRYPEADLYFAVFGALTTEKEARIVGFDDLAGAQNLRAVEFSAIFIAATMNPPGIEPPLELR